MIVVVVRFRKGSHRVNRFVRFIVDAIRFDCDSFISDSVPSWSASGPCPTSSVEK